MSDPNLNNLSEVKISSVSTESAGFVGGSGSNNKLNEIIELLRKQFPNASLTELTEMAKNPAGVGTLLKTSSTDNQLVQSTDDSDVNATTPNPSAKEQSVLSDAKSMGKIMSESPSGVTYDLATYEKLPEKEMMDKFVEEYAKNKFLYSGGKEKTASEWNPEERQKEIQEARKEIEAKGSKIIASLQPDDALNNIEAKKALPAAMLALQVANFKERDISDIKKMKPKEVEQALQEYLSERKNSNLSSKTEESIMATQMSILDAKKEALAGAGFIRGDENLSPEEIDTLCADNKINVGKALKNHLNHKIENGEALTDTEKLVYEKMKHIDLDKYPGLFSRFGQTSKLQEMMKSDQDFREKLVSAKTPEEKRQIRKEFLKQKLTDPKTGKIDEKLYMELYNDMVECGSPLMGKNPIMEDFLSIGNDKLRDQISKKKDVGSQMNYVEHIGSFNRAQKSMIAAGIEQRAKEDPDLGGFLYDGVCKKTEDKDKDAVAVVGAFSKNAEIRRIATNTTMQIENQVGSENATRAIKEYARKTNDDTELNYVIDNLGSAVEENRLSMTTIVTEGNAQVSKRAVEKKVVELMPAKHQVDGYKMLQNRIENENLFSDKDAVELAKNLASQIGNCDKSNQLAMHNLTLQSKYSEVVEFAVKNISTYDESVQADALQSTFEYADKTGNTHLKDLACEQVPKLSKSAQEQINSNPSLRAQVRSEMIAYEQRHPEAVLTKFGEYSQEDNLVRNPKKKSDSVSENDTTADSREKKIEMYKEEFKNASISKKFRLIRKLQPEYQTKFFDYIATYAPGLFTSLLQAKGTDVFKLGLSMDAKNKAMREMLNNVDMRREALKYYKEYPSQFGDSVKRLVESLERNESEENELVYRDAETQRTKKYIPQQNVTYLA